MGWTLSLSLIRLLQNEGSVLALSFNYGQRHSKELAVASHVCTNLGVPHLISDIISIHSLIGNSSLMTGGDTVPEGHYEAENMKSTVVPNRNMIRLSLAIGYAVSEGAKEVYYGAHSGDHAIYPDCRPEFVNRMNDVAKIANYEPVEIKTPYLHMSKGEILREGLALGLNYTDSWTCYNGRERACGKCGACVERLEAFRENGVSDPLLYEECA